MRTFTWFECKTESTMVQGIRTDLKCHNCKEVIHLVDLKDYEELKGKLDQLIEAIKTKPLREIKDIARQVTF